MVNALENGAEEGRDYLRKVWGSWKWALIPECPNGETQHDLSHAIRKWIHSLREGNPGNWNILVPGGKENKLMIPLVAASERGTGQTSLRAGVVGLLLELQSYRIVEATGK